MSSASSQSTQPFSEVSEPGADLEELIGAMASLPPDAGAARVFARSYGVNARYIDMFTYPDQTPAMILDKGILAISQSAQATACDITIPILRPGTVGTHLRLWFDPTADGFVAMNMSDHAPLTLRDPQSYLGKQWPPQYCARLQPGTWTILSSAAPNEKVLCTELLDILLRPRTFYAAPTPVSDASSQTKRRGSTETLSSKKQKATTGALRKQTSVAVHPLLQLQDGQTLVLSGHNRDDNYTITRQKHLTTTRSASLYTSQFSLRPGQVVVTKALAIIPGALAQTAKSWFREVSTHQGVGPHPRIVSFLGSDARVFSLYTEYVDTPSLSKHIDDSQHCNCSQSAFTILSDIADALQFIHASGFAHNDVKPSNILYHPNRGAIVIDFGLGTKTKDPAPSGGTPWYVPPEYLRRGKRGPLGDIFALGVTMLWVLRKCTLPDHQQTWMIRDLQSHGQKFEVRARAEGMQRNWLTQVNTMMGRLSNSERSIESVVRRMVCEEGRSSAAEVVKLLKSVSPE